MCGNRPVGISLRDLAEVAADEQFELVSDEMFVSPSESSSLSTW